MLCKFLVFVLNAKNLQHLHKCFISHVTVALVVHPNIPETVLFDSFVARLVVQGVPEKRTEFYI